MRNKSLYRLTSGAAIAAIYVILTELSTLMGLSSNVIQFRLSEALCILPAFTPVAIPALTVGCVISNILAGCPLPDIIFGSLATLIGACGAYLLKKRRYLIPLPTVLANMLIIPFILRYVWNFPGSLWYFTMTVGIGEVVCAYIFGIFLHRVMDKYKDKLFL